MAYLGAILGVGILCMVLERVAPGRGLPHAPGWHLRAVFFNTCQLGVVCLAGATWEAWLRDESLFSLDPALPDPLEGLVAWLVGTFCFYWWHRLRHRSHLCWRIFHQIHHSPARIEILTAFYKHPLEIAANSVLASLILYPLLGCSIAGAGWFNVFAASGEFFYHANLRTPRWIGLVMQRPEHHSIHHQDGVHDFNYGDVTWWDRLFGTFRDTDRFAPACGFPGDREVRIGTMLAGRDVS